MVVKRNLDTEKFGADKSNFLDTRMVAEERVNELGVPTPIEELQLPEIEILEEVTQRAQELMSGRLPEDIQNEINEQISILSAEQSLQGGTGQGQKGKFLTFRDLGLNVVDVANAGTELAFQVGALEANLETSFAQLNLQREQFNQEIQLRYDTLTEEIRRWDDQFNAIMSEHDLNVEKVRLAGLELVSRNQQFMQGLVNDLIINNSRIEIPGVQENVDDLLDFFFESNTGILDRLGI